MEKVAERRLHQRQQVLDKRQAARGQRRQRSDVENIAFFEEIPSLSSTPSVAPRSPVPESRSPMRQQHGQRTVLQHVSAAICQFSSI